MKKLLLAILLLLGIIVIGHAVLSYRHYNVILITIDTLRADYVHCYNPGAAATANLDRIAENGVLFTNAFILIPITMPSHTSILTSRQPYELGLFNNGDHFDHRVPMISEVLKRENYTSAAFISLGVLSKAFGLARGFDFYEDNFDHTNGRFYKSASEVNASVLPWLEQQRNNRFFAWIHYSDPHEPYVTPGAPPDTAVFINGKPYSKFTLAKKERITLDFLAKPGLNEIEFNAIDYLRPASGNQKSLPRHFLDPKIEVSPANAFELSYGKAWIELTLRNGQHIRFSQQERANLVLTNKSTEPRPVRIRFSGGVWEERVGEVRKNYAAEVQYTDKYIGELWSKLAQSGLLNNTIVVVTADHGEGLKTHGILGHVDMLWNETARIPLLIYYPHLGYKGKKVGDLVNLLDIMPTILDLLHVRNKPTMEGQSLRRYVSRSPVDFLLSRKVNRTWTYACTFTPEAAHNSFAIMNGKLKLIHSPEKRVQWEAYDLVKDPIEKKNLAKFDPQRFESLGSMRSLLESHEREAEAAHERRRNPQLTPEEQQILQNLGYVGGEETPPQP